MGGHILLYLRVSAPVWTKHISLYRGMKILWTLHKDNEHHKCCASRYKRRADQGFLAAGWLIKLNESNTWKKFLTTLRIVFGRNDRLWVDFSKAR